MSEKSRLVESGNWLMSSIDGRRKGALGALALVGLNLVLAACESQEVVVATCPAHTQLFVIAKRQSASPQSYNLDVDVTCSAQGGKTFPARLTETNGPTQDRTMPGTIIISYTSRDNATPRVIGHDVYFTNLALNTESTGDVNTDYTDHIDWNPLS